MVIAQMLASFLSTRFPWWGVCHFCFDPIKKTLFLYCATPGRRTAIVNDLPEIAQLDIGIDHFVVVHPDFADLIIDCGAASL
jgi:hypothetical protein